MTGYAYVVPDDPDKPFTDDAPTRRRLARRLRRALRDGCHVEVVGPRDDLELLPAPCRCHVVARWMLEAKLPPRWLLRRGHDPALPRDPLLPVELAVRLAVGVAVADDLGPHVVVGAPVGMRVDVTSHLPVASGEVYDSPSLIGLIASLGERSTAAVSCPAVERTVTVMADGWDQWAVVLGGDDCEWFVRHRADLDAVIEHTVEWLAGWV